MPKADLACVAFVTESNGLAWYAQVSVHRTDANLGHLAVNPGSAGVSPAFGRAFDRRFRARTRCRQDAGATLLRGPFLSQRTHGGVARHSGHHYALKQLQSRHVAMVKCIRSGGENFKNPQGTAI